MSVAVVDRIALHCSSWKDGERDHAAGMGYRVENGGPLSVVLGAAYVGTVTENLLRHRTRTSRCGSSSTAISRCQVSHYSTIGDDNGENFLFCGWRWRSRAQALFGD